MSAIDNALTTLARFKSFAELTGSSKDTLLTIIIVAASKQIERYCRRTFARTSYSNQEINGKGSDKIILPNTPIDTSQAFSLQRRSTALNQGSWETIGSELYFVEQNGIVTFHGDSWLLEPLASTRAFYDSVKNFRASYTAGFYLPSSGSYTGEGAFDLPQDLEYACMELVQAKLNNRRSRGIKTEKVKDISITYKDIAELDPDIKAILDYYKTPRVG